MRGSTAAAGLIEGASARHLSSFPHGGSVLWELSDDLVGYSVSKGTLRFPADSPLPEELVSELIAARRQQLGGG